MSDPFDIPAAGQEEAGEGGVQLREYWNTLLKRIWTVVFIFVATVTGVALYTFQLPKIYQAEALVIINFESPKVLGQGIDDTEYQSAGDWFTLAKHYETQLHVIQSRHVAERVVREEGLAEDLNFLGLEGIEDEEQLATALENSDPAARLMSMLIVEPVSDTQIVSIKVQHTDPEMSARLANAVAEAYRDQNIEHRMKAMQDAFQWLNDQYDAYETKLGESRQMLNDFKIDNPLLFTNPEEQQSLTTDRIAKLDELLVETERERRALGYMLTELDNFEISNVGSAGLQILSGEASLGGLTSQYIELKRLETELLHKYLETAPQVQSVREQMTLIDDSIKAEISSIRRGYQSRYDVVSRSESDLSQRIAALEKEALKLDQLKLLYEQVESQKEEQQRLFELVQRRLNEVSLSKLLESNNIRILDRATTPSTPVSPQTMFNILVGAVVGLLAGIGVAFLLEMMDNTVKSQEDIESRVNIPFLGVIPVVRENDRRGASRPVSDEEYRRDLHVNFFPKSSVAECARTIRTNLLFMSPGKELNVILVTSPSPLDGKTTSAVSLATVMAQSSSRVLLLEGDLRRPRLHKAFDLEPKGGVADVLIENATLDEVILKTQVEGLDMLPCGTVPPNPSELFHTESFKGILEQLRERYDRIIIDSPPVIAVTDAMVLAQHVDGVIVVTKAGSTRRELLTRTKQLLDGINAPILGAILNNVNLANRRYGTYYYYYYRQYGQYYEETEELPS